MDNLNYSNGVKKISLASPSLASQRRFQNRSRLPAAGERYPLESAPSPTSGCRPLGNCLANTSTGVRAAGDSPLSLRHSRVESLR